MSNIYAKKKKKTHRNNMLLPVSPVIFSCVKIFQTCAIRQSGGNGRRAASEAIKQTDEYGIIIV